MCPVQFAAIVRMPETSASFTIDQIVEKLMPKAA
jgi:hypothetical protein